MNHTEEPWMVRPDATSLKAHVMTRWQNVFDSHLPICDMDFFNTPNMANAERIVACVNGCAGITNPSAVKDMYEALSMFVNGCDNEIDDPASYAYLLERKARAALAKADGR